MRRSMRVPTLVLAMAVTAATTAVGAVAPSSAAPPGVATTQEVSGTLRDGAAMAAGGFGMPSGTLDTRVGTGARDPVSTGTGTGEFGSQGGCGYYANNAGMGLYCGGFDGDVLTLAEQFGGHPGLTVCKVFSVPDGMSRPDIDRDDDFFWALQGCMEGIDWNTATGGTGIEITMEWYKVPLGETVEEQNTPVADYIWDMSQENYPMPLVTIEPDQVPRVNADAIFTFDWVDATKDGFPVVSEGPFAGDPDGGPYQEIAVGGDVMRAEATEIVLDPLVDGMRSKECETDPPEYDPDLGPSHEDQNTECYLKFPSSSAAAEDLTQMPLPDEEENYFLVRIEVTWQVQLDLGNDGQSDDDLGVYQLDTYQQVPVQQVLGNNYYYD